MLDIYDTLKESSRITFPQGEVTVGCIKDILDNNGPRVVILEIFQVSSSRDEIFGMPVLTRRHAEVTFLIIPVLVCFPNPYCYMTLKVV